MCREQKNKMVSLCSNISVITGNINNLNITIEIGSQDFPGAPMVKNPPSSAGEAGLIPLPSPRETCKPQQRASMLKDPMCFS